MSFPIVIVNYRAAPLVVDCLRSLVPEIAERAGYRVYVVDNASGDGSFEVLRDAVAANGWTWAEVIPCDRNLGFAGGNNIALRPLLTGSAQPDYVLLLNPDTVVRPGALRELEAFLEQHPKVGIAGSRLEDPDGTPQRSAFRFFSVAGELVEGLRLKAVAGLLPDRVIAPPVRDEPHETDWVAGASMLVRREVFDAIGLMDEKYFLYFEETDFCLRAKRAGWTTWYVPSSRVVHLVGQSTGVTDTKKPRRRLPQYWFESREYYFRKNHGVGYAAAANAVWLAAFGIWRARRWLLDKPDTDPPHMLEDFVRFTVGQRSSGGGARA